MSFFEKLKNAWTSWKSPKQPMVEPTHPNEVIIIPPAQATEPAKNEPAKCGCGRSPDGMCQGLHGLTDAEYQAWKDMQNREAVAPQADSQPQQEIKVEAAPEVTEAQPVVVETPVVQEPPVPAPVKKPRVVREKKPKMDKKEPKQVKEKVAKTKKSKKDAS